jgi:hypothetical protein
MSHLGWTQIESLKKIMFFTTKKFITTIHLI